MQFLLNSRHTFDDLFSLFGKDYPWLETLYNTQQDSIWHSEGNVAIHTDMVMSACYDLIDDNESWSDDFKISLILGAFFHDIGKAVTTKEIFKNNRMCIGAPKHEETGFNYLFYRFKEDDRLKPYVSKILQIVGYHHIPKMTIIKDMSYWELLEYRHKFYPELLYYFSTADIKGRIREDKDEQLEYIELFKILMKENKLWNSDFIDPLVDSFKQHSSEAQQFMQQKALYHLKNNDIYMPIEIESKYYDSLPNNFAKLYILCGLSGSGKSTIAESIEHDRLISLDNIRLTFTKDLSNRKYEGQVLQKAKESLKEGLANKETIVYDATNLRKDFRDKLVQLAINYKAYHETIFVDTSLKESIKNDKSRNNFVGESIIKKQSTKFEHPFY